MGSASRSRMLYTTRPPLNVHGLPMRVGVKRCLHYLRYSYCEYGVHCAYHHPNPKHNKHKPNKFNNMPHHPIIPYYNSDHPSSSSSPPQPIMPYNPSATTYYSCNYNGVDTHTIAPPLCLLPQPPTLMHPQWLLYQQAPGFTYNMPGQSVMPQLINPAAVANYGADRIMPLQNDHSTPIPIPIPIPVVEEFPQHPDQPICAHFLTTGDCRFRSACRFHHPHNWAVRRNECILSDKGLPLRPDRAVCQHYASLGLCKSGPACLFDHPVDFQFISTSSKHRKDDGEGSSSMTKQE